MSSIIDIRTGPSTTPDASNDLFIDTSTHTFTAGTVVGTYWGPDTENQGLPITLLAPGAAIPYCVRDDGAYLLRHGDYMVEADPSVQWDLLIKDGKMSMHHSNRIRRTRGNSSL